MKRWPMASWREEATTPSLILAEILNKNKQKNNKWAVQL
jgi:hypothetical protein